LLDRIDLQIEVPSLSAQVLASAPQGDTSGDVAQRVAQAHERQLARQACLNAFLAGPSLDTHCVLSDSAAEFFQNTCNRLGWSGRSYQRVLRIARTIADLHGEQAITVGHLAEAIQYRRVLKAS
jgi:magnesium chelatase family protein